MTSELKPQMKKEIKKEAMVSVIWGVLMLSLAFAAQFAHKQGYISADMVHRVVALNGLWMAYYGNRIPKKVAPTGCARQAMRLSGWSMVLSGLVYAGLWAFAPVQTALVFGTAAVVGGIALTFGYCAWLHMRTRRPQANA